MAEIVYEKGMTWSIADFRLKIQYSMSVLLIVAGITLAFLSLFLFHEIGMGVFSMSSFFVGAALGIYGIGMMVKNQMNDFKIKVEDEINRLNEGERRRNERFNKRFNTDNTADDFSHIEHLPDNSAGEDSRAY